MSKINERLTEARKRAGFTSALEAADAMGIKYPTYAGHENGTTGLRLEVAERYAKKFKVSLDWLATGRGAGPNGTDPNFQELASIWPQMSEAAQKAIIDTARAFAGRK